MVTILKESVPISLSAVHQYSGLCHHSIQISYRDRFQSELPDLSPALNVTHFVGRIEPSEVAGFVWTALSDMATANFPTETIP